MSTAFLKKYKILQKIGEGSFSEVVKCQERETGLICAAKRLKKTYKSLNDVLDSPEVMVMRKISQHANILCMIETHYDPVTYEVTLMFELMDMSLYDLIKGRKGRLIPEQRVKCYYYQMLKGLEHLHKHGIFHRDIKPENILIKMHHSGSVVKIADLGFIKGIYSRPPYTEYISTRWYRSPECLLTTGFYGPKIDVWAAGCVFFELLTLKPLFPGANEVDQIAKIHTILGTPHARIVAKFRRHKSRNCEYFFPMKEGIGLNVLLPNVTEDGKAVLKSTLIYDPENRINVKRLLENHYFDDFREVETSRRCNTVQTSSSNTQWRNPMLMSYMATDRHRRLKNLNALRNKVTAADETRTKALRAVASTPNTKSAMHPVVNLKAIDLDGTNSTIVEITKQKEHPWYSGAGRQQGVKQSTEESSSTSNYFTKMTRSRTKQNESLEFVSPGPKVASLPLIHRDNVLVNHQSPWRGKVNQVDRQQSCSNVFPNIARRNNPTGANDKSKEESAKANSKFRYFLRKKPQVALPTIKEFMSSNSKVKNACPSDANYSPGTKSPANKIPKHEPSFTNSNQKLRKIQDKYSKQRRVKL